MTTIASVATITSRRRDARLPVLTPEIIEELEREWGFQGAPLREQRELVQ